MLMVLPVRSTVNSHEANTSLKQTATLVPVEFHLCLSKADIVLDPMAEGPEQM